LTIALTGDFQSSKALGGLFMPSKKDSEPLPTRVQSSFHKLKGAASELNAASDRFAKLIGEIDATLKPLNIGITCWVKMGVGWNDGYLSGYDQVGYTKITGKWGVALSSVTANPNEVTDFEEWMFSDGPRRLRLLAIDYIPELLDELAKQAVKGTKDIAEKISEVEGLVSALKEA
jgi:hypothetical protein